jgi:hypothetical protein
MAAKLAQTSPLPLMLTGGITRCETAEQVLSSGVARSAWQAHGARCAAIARGSKPERDPALFGSRRGAPPGGLPRCRDLV